MEGFWGASKEKYFLTLLRELLQVSPLLSLPQSDSLSLSVFFSLYPSPNVREKCGPRGICQPSCNMKRLFTLRTDHFEASHTQDFFFK